MTLNFQSLQTTILPAPVAGRIPHAHHGQHFCLLACPGTDCRTATDRPATRLAPGRLGLPATLRRRLLLQPLAQPFPPPLRLRTQSRSDRSPGRFQPAHGLAPARALFQGSDPGRPPPPGGAASRQTPATLRRPHRRVHADARRRHALRRAGLHPAHLGRPRVHGGLAPLLQEVRSGSCDPRGGHGSHAGPGACGRTRAAPRRRFPAPRRASAASPFFVSKTQYAGAFLLMPQALNWLATAQDCFTDDYGSLRQGLLTRVFALVIGLQRVFHLDDMADAGFARLCGGRRGPSRHPVGGWRRHLAWYEVDAFCRRTCPWHLIRNADVMVSFDEHTIPRWTKKFHIGKGYVTTRNKYMRCEKLFTGFDLESGRFLTIRGTPRSEERRVG